MTQLKKYQASVLSMLFECLPLGDEVDTLEFSLSGTFAGKYRAGHSTIESTDKPAQVVFSLPTYSRSVFLALTRANPIETARVLANLEDYERESSLQLGLGEVVVTPDQVRRDSDTPFAVILLRTATSLDCTNVPDQQDICGQRTLFFLVVPITKGEWDLRRERGHDALMDKFQIDRKDLFFWG